MSIPEESAVAYSGKALFDLFMILTWINDMRTKISDKAQGTRFKLPITASMAVDKQKILDGDIKFFQAKQWRRQLFPLHDQ
jgi:hypothetical protein